MLNHYIACIFLRMFSCKITLEFMAGQFILRVSFRKSVFIVLKVMFLLETRQTKEAEQSFEQTCSQKLIEITSLRTTLLMVATLQIKGSV